MYGLTADPSHRPRHAGECSVVFAAARAGCNAQSTFKHIGHVCCSGCVGANADATPARDGAGRAHTLDDLGDERAPRCTTEYHAAHDPRKAGTVQRSETRGADETNSAAQVIMRLRGFATQERRCDKPASLTFSLR